MASYLSQEAIECLYAEHGLPENIIRHMQTVARVAVFMAQQLKVGEEIDIALVEKGALLHDLDKLITLKQNGAHGALGGRLLRERGQDVIASIVERHPISAFGKSDPRLWTWEERLVHYADKLCLETRVVTLAERLEDLRHRYPQKENASYVERYQAAEENLEREIFACLDLEPADVPRLLARSEH